MCPVVSPLLPGLHKDNKYLESRERGWGGYPKPWQAKALQKRLLAVGKVTGKKFWQVQTGLERLEGLAVPAKSLQAERGSADACPVTAEG